MRRFSVQYVERLLAGNDYSQLVELSTVVCGSPMFAPTAANYGLPPAAFVFIESLCWFAQATRSGAWTYYEATPHPRQKAMCKALREHAPPGYADWYERGMSDWEDEQRMRAVDAWMEANDGAAERWLREFVVQNSEILIALAA